jgi:hypothetical protein
MKVYALSCTYGGVVNDVLLFINKKEATKKQKELYEQADQNDDDIVLWEVEL